MKRRYFSSIWFTLSFFLNIPLSWCQSLDANPVFGDRTIPVVKIIIDPDSLGFILNPFNSESDHEFPATFIFSTQSIQDTVENIGFRLRGNTSRQSNKKSFKVSFNTFIRGRKYHGLEKLNLNGEHNDPSIIRSKLCWDLFEKMRVPASRANHVLLYINDKYYGLYINVEHVDENFVRSRFGNNDGNLYKCLYPANLVFIGDDPESYKTYNGRRRVYDLKTNTEADDYTDLAEFIGTINNTPPVLAEEVFEKIFDVNAFLRYLAVEVLVGSWDDYWFWNNNFYLYRNTATGKFEFIPYDYDNSFGIWWDGIYPGIDWGKRSVYNWGHPDQARPLVTQILSMQKFRDQFSFYVKQLLDLHFNLTVWEPNINYLHTLITPAAEQDVYRTYDYGFTIEDFHNSYNYALGGHVTYGIKEYISVRHSSAASQVIPNNIAPILSELTVTPEFPNAQDSIHIQVLFEDEARPAAFQLHYSVNENDRSPVSFSEISSQTEWLQRGYFRATLPPVEGAASIKFYISTTDDKGLQTLEPTSAPFSVHSIEVENVSLPKLFINEFMASNRTTVFDETGAAGDWIELYNGDSKPVLFSNLFLTDNLLNTDKWPLPDTTLQPGEFLLIWADDDEEQGPTHAPFKLDKDGEQIGIFQAENDGFYAVDTLSYGPQQTDISFGRVEDGAPAWQHFAAPTPGLSNSAQVQAAAQSTKKPLEFLLAQNYPNPFNNETIIVYTLPQAGEVTLEVFNMLGESVRTFSEKNLRAGKYSIKWNGLNSVEQPVASGIYFIRLLHKSEINTTHSALIKAMYLR